MYEELIKVLRNTDFSDGCPCEAEQMCDNNDCIIIQAADAIEELSNKGRPTGRWIWDDEGYHCSECFFHAYGNTLECMDGTYKYCPNCGAKMEVEE